MKFNIHAGHGKQDSKSCGANGLIKESVENRKVKDELIRLLKLDGHTVFDTTVDYPSSAGACINKIVTNCNKNTVDLDISIHFNAGRKDNNGDGDNAGIEVLLYNSTSKAKPYADRVCKKVSSSLKLDNRGIKYRTDLGVLKTKNPNMLIECCFVDDKDDVNLYNYKTMAKAIAEGILNKSIVEEVKPAGKFQVICGSYSDRANAVAMQEKLKEKGFDSFLEFESDR